MAPESACKHLPRVRKLEYKQITFLGTNNSFLFFFIHAVKPKTSLFIEAQINIPLSARLIEDFPSLIKSRVFFL
jgi:hypothetical protein